MKMAPSSRINKSKGTPSRGPTDSPGVASGVAHGATGQYTSSSSHATSYLPDTSHTLTGSPASAVPAASPAAVSAAPIRPADIPRCRFCFKFSRVCDGARPCDSCSRNKRLCRDVDQLTLDQFPERAQRLIHEHELAESAASNSGTKKRAAATPAPSGGQKAARKKQKTTRGTDERTKEERFKRKQARELRHCYRAVNELLSDRHAGCNAYFLDPVDHVALNLPHYRSIVEFPMDLGTMKENLEDGEYRSAREFKRDFMKVVHAAKLFNEEGSDVYEAAGRLQEVFDVVWEETKHGPAKKKSEKGPDGEDGRPEEDE